MADVSKSLHAAQSIGSRGVKHRKPVLWRSRDEFHGWQITCDHLALRFESGFSCCHDNSAGCPGVKFGGGGVVWGCFSGPLVQSCKSKLNTSSLQRDFEQCYTASFGEIVYKQFHYGRYIKTWTNGWVWNIILSVN